MIDAIRENWQAARYERLHRQPGGHVFPMRPEEHDAIDQLEKAIRIGEECAQFLRSESVEAFLDDMDRQLVEAAIQLPLAQHEERYLALAAAKTVRELRTFMIQAARQRAYNQQQIDALYRKRAKE